MEIEVIDELMGNGKTTTVLRYIENDHIQTGKKWLYCTEYLNELRTRTEENPEAAGLWCFPTNDEGTKVESFFALVNERKGLIGITHNLLKLLAAHPEAQAFMLGRGYSLYIDETISLIDVCKVKQGDFMMWLNNGLIAIDSVQNGKVIRTDKEANTAGLLSTFDWFEKECRSGCIHASIRQSEEGAHFVAVTDHVPVGLLCHFDRIILTTYLFEGSVMHSYFKLNNIKPTKSDIGVKSRVTMQKVRELLKIDDKYNKHFEGHSLSASWYKEASAGKHQKVIDLLGKTIRNAAEKHGCEKDHSLLGYTHPIDSLPKHGKQKGFVRPERYKPQVFIRSENGKVTKEVDKEKSCFIPCSARASNEYAHKKVMIHAFNRYPNQVVATYLQDAGAPINKDRFALSEMIQWIWRSCIRKGEEVTVLVLSERMNKLLKEWLLTFSPKMLPC